MQNFLHLLFLINDKTVFKKAVAAIAGEFTDDDFMLNTLDGMLANKGERLWRTATVRELIFDGMSIKTYLDLFNNDIVQAAAEAAGTPLHIPENIADGKFALLKGVRIPNA